MARTIDTFTGAETGRLEELSLTSGSPAASTAQARTGTYSYLLAGNATRPVMRISSSNGDDLIVGFAIYLTSTSPAAAYEFFTCYDGAISNVQMTWEMQTNGDVKIGNAGFGSYIATLTAPFSLNAWHWVECRWQNSASAALDIWIDGVSKVSLTGQNLFRTSAFGSYTWRGHNAAGKDIYIDDIYTAHGASGTADFLGGASNTVQVIGPYQSTAAGATDQGTALDAGTWANVSETPVNDTNTAAYTNHSGSTITSGGTRPGPNGDTRFTYGTIIAAKWVHRLKRAAGGVTYNKLYGNSVDGVTTTSVALTASFANYVTVSESASVVPQATEYFQHGFSVVGADTATASEIWAFLLQYTTPSTVTYPKLERGIRGLNRGLASGAA